MKLYPEYYKDIEFITIDGRQFIGYLEPPFDADGEPFFITGKDSELLFSVDCVRKWKYITL